MNKNWLALFLGIIFTLIACNKTKETPKIVQTSDLKEEFYNNGDIKLRVQLKDGVQHGSYTEYFKNQIVKEEGIKVKGKKNGLWKFYNSEGVVINAKHFYNDSLVNNLDIKDFVYNEIFLDNDSLKIQIPQEWDLVEDFDEGSPVLLAARKNCDQRVSFCPSISVTYEPSINLAELEVYIKKSDSVLELSFNNYKVIKQRKYKHDSNIFYEKIYKGESQGIKLGAITTWILLENKTYIITGVSLNEKGNSFLKYEGLFKDIIDNISIIQ